MLSSLDLSMLTNALGTGEGEKSSMFSMGSELNEDSGNPFLAILKELGIDPQSVIDEQDLAAVLQKVSEKIGEDLPPDGEMSDSINIEDSPEAIPDNPETYTGDTLLSYLMANAGLNPNAALHIRVTDSIPKNSLNSTDLPEDSDEGILTEHSENEAWQNQLNEPSEDKLAKLLKPTDQNPLNPVVEFFKPKATVPDSAKNTEAQKQPEFSATVELEQPVLMPDLDDTTVEHQDMATQSDISDSLQSSLENDGDATTETAKSVSATVAGFATSVVKEPVKTGDSMVKDVDDVVKDDDPDTELKSTFSDSKGTVVKPNSDAVTKDVNQAQSPDKTAPVAIADDRSGFNNKPELMKSKEAVIETGENFKPLLAEAQHFTHRPLAHRDAATTAQIAEQTNDLNRAVKLPQMGQALSERIQTLVAGDIKHAFIRLDPPELGALEVRIHIQHDQTHIQIVSPNAHVRDALEQHSVRLREALADQGLSLGNLDVADQQQREQANSEGGQQGLTGEESEPIEADLEPSTLTELTSNVGMVDHFV